MNILIFAPHPDDEVLGCGGIIAKHTEYGDDVSVCVVTSPQKPIYNNQLAIKNEWPHILYPEIQKSHELLGIKHTIFLQFPAAALEAVPRHKLNEEIYKVIRTERPEIVYIPHFGDMQKDHALVSEAVMVAVRPRGDQVVHKVYAYETLSETEWNIPHVSNVFLPNVFVDITDYLKKKKAAMECYGSQLRPFPDPRSLEAIDALAKVRGSAAGVWAAEAFSLIREYDLL